MQKRLSLLWVVLALLTPMLGRAQVTLTLSTPVVTAIPGTTAQFSGKLTNTSSSTLFLNDLTFTFNGGTTLTADNTRFFDLVSATLDPGETYNGLLFEVNIDGAAAPGNYTGQVTVSGSNAPDVSNILSIQSFRVTVVSRKLSGTVLLDGVVNSVVPITFEFRPTDGTPSFIRAMLLSSTGAYSLSGLPAKAYTVHIKGSKWLATNLSVDLSSGDSSGASTVLYAGDANDDNTVDIVDFGILINAYGGNSAVADSGYDYTADFNNDGSIDIADFSLVVNNYGSSGDM